MTPSRWVLCANHTEPVKGFLGRFLRRKLMETEISGRMRNVELVKIIDWIPKVWHHLNRFLEAHSSSDVTIGRAGQVGTLGLELPLLEPWPPGMAGPGPWQLDAAPTTQMEKGT